jgi:hypothetical protein
MNLFETVNAINFRDKVLDFIIFVQFKGKVELFVVGVNEGWKA